MPEDLAQDETHLLLWLARDVAQYGECHGKTLDRLRERGYVLCISTVESNPAAVAEIWPPPSYNHGVELSEAGYTKAKEIREQFKVGTPVEGGRYHDTGVVVDPLNDFDDMANIENVYVAWDNGTRTWTPICTLRPRC